MNGVCASASASSSPAPLLSMRTKLHANGFTSATRSVFLGNSNLSICKLKKIGCSGKNRFQRIGICCNGSTGPTDPDSTDSGSRSTLDAFFLGKALADALTERLESTMGEMASKIGRLQAEQQKKLQIFQEEVVERAKKAKDKAERDAIEAKDLLSMSIASTDQPSTAPESDSDSSKHDDSVKGA